jgi:uncharacterized membrane protein YkvA (DUF1232 family)
MNIRPNDMIASLQRRAREAQDHPVLGPYMGMISRLPVYVRLATDLARDPEVPASAKASLVAAGAYAVSPIDLVPGIIPVAGQMDDLAALLLAIRFAIRLTPKEVAVPHLERAGISPQQLDEDVSAVRDSSIWLARRAANGLRNAAVNGAHRVRASVRRWVDR